MTGWALEAFGMSVDSLRRLPGMTPGSASAPRPNRELRLVFPTRAEFDARWSGAAGPPVWQTILDGRPSALEVGIAGDLRFGFGDEASFRISADAATVACHATAREDERWQRVLLDTVLACASLVRGHEVLHAAGVGHDGDVVAIMGHSGAGKSTLAIELMRRGRPLFSDDLIVLRPGTPLLAHPGPPLLNCPGASVGTVVPALGEAVAEIDGETWVQVHHAVDGPRRVAAIVLLRRAPGLATALQRLPSSPLMLLGEMLALGHLAGRARTRFAVAGDLAGDTRLFRLDADERTPPSLLADLVEDGLAGRMEVSDGPASLMP
jgi:hypothetical protein